MLAAATNKTYGMGTRHPMRTTESGGAEMTETQYLTILGTIWVAPYVNKWYALVTGVVLLIISLCKSVGWL